MDNTQNLTKRQRRELRRQERQAEKEKSVSRKKIVRWVIIIVTALIIAGVAYLLLNSSSDGQAVIINDNPWLGTEDAAVVVTEYSDFSCPACSAAAPTVKQLFDEYDGQIKIEFSAFDLQYKWSAKSLEAGYCAEKQGKFWEYHDLIFSRQSEWKAADDALDQFKTMAEELEMDEALFNTCLDSGEMGDKVKEATNRGRVENINATPTFDINGEKIVGAKPLDEFKSVIDRVLNN